MTRDETAAENVRLARQMRDVQADAFRIMNPGEVPARTLRDIIIDRLAVYERSAVDCEMEIAAAVETMRNATEYVPEDALMKLLERRRVLRHVISELRVIRDSKLE